MTRQAFTSTNVLRLEVGAPPATGLRNLLKNPHGLRGPWGWLTPGPTIAATTYMLGATVTESFTVTPALRFRSDSVDPLMNFATSEPEPVTVGQYASAQVRLAALFGAGRSAELSIVFFDKAGVQIGGRNVVTAIPNGAALNSVHTTAPVVIPALTAYASVRVDAVFGSAGTRGFDINQAMLTTGATSGAVTGYAFVEPFTYTDILAPAYALDVAREGLSVGTLTASIRDTTLDPALAASLIKPGRPIRLMARTSDAAGALTSVYEPLFVGEIKHAAVKYDLLAQPATKRANITLTAVDGTARAANFMQPQTVASIADLSFTLEGCGVPFEVNNIASLAPGSPTVVATNPNATVLDQVATTRDTKLAHAWASRWGVLKAKEPASMSATVMATLTEADYRADLDIGFDTARCINTVTVKRLAIVGGETVETVFGPYVDDASVRDWGVFAEEFTVAGLSDAAVATYGASILAANATPQVTVNSAVLPIVDNADLRTASGPYQHRAHLDIGDRVTISNTTAALTKTLRITSVRHAITPTKWLTTLGFATTGGVSLPSPAPTLPDGAATFPDTDWTPVTFIPANGWSNLAGWQGVQYCRRNGIVYLQGTGVPGTNAVAAFTLPAGFRVKVKDIKQGNTNSLNLTAGRFDVMPNGDVIPQGAVTWLGFSTSYPAEQ